MKKPFTNSLTVIFAVLAVYLVAFKMLMRVGSMWIVMFDHKSPPILSGAGYGITLGGEDVAFHEPRWGRDNEMYRNTLSAFFAPLIWMERKVRGLDNWKWDRRGPRPDWVTHW